MRRLVGDPVAGGVDHLELPCPAAETPAGVLDREEQSLCIGAHIAGVPGYIDTPHARYIQRPEHRSVVGIKGVDPVVALAVEPAIHIERRLLPGLAVNHSSRTGTAIPLDSHAGGRNQLIAAGGGIVRRAVHMAPLTGPLEDTPYHCGPDTRRFELFGSHRQIRQPASESLQGHIVARARGLTKDRGPA